MTSILWFKRDLRVADHPALARAVAAGPVLPLYIIEPDYWQEPDMSVRQWDFVQESLIDLRQQLTGIGLRLVIRVGVATDILDDLRRTHAVSAMFSHEETGNSWTYARDLAVADWARVHGVIWTELAQSGVVRRLNGRDGWAKARNTFLREEQVRAPSEVRGVNASSDEVPDLLPPDYCPQRQIGGRTMAMKTLGSFLTERGATYRRDMSSPLTGANACSRLSPYLAWGCLSGREAAQAGAARQREVNGDWAKSLQSFQARLAWRDHFMQKLEDQPTLERRCLHSAYEGLRVDHSARRQAWEKGETGLPFVDACMRYVAATGWLNFRMRSMVMAVASYHLWLDWRRTGLLLARQFTDYEAGIHWPQTQMQSGTTGMNTIRIYNPIKQGHDQDPTGVFTRRWVPELADVPDAYLQEPWKWEDADTLAYPAPIVDVTAAAKEARYRIYAVHRRDGFRAEAARVIDKHASRKDPRGHFVNDRDPRRKTRDQRQGAFDF
ncbi:FAD-binding domain-containing protein [Yoonia sp. 2307UL14-13]|uniref:FAD-binding domain-containing protein n=1 Tax=Yoonia sp. 2307UL14-13 TaxID=3126506 RepID=UPI0030AD4488